MRSKEHRGGDSRAPEETRNALGLGLRERLVELSFWTPEMPTH